MTAEKPGLSEGRLGLRLGAGRAIVAKVASAPKTADPEEVLEPLREM